MQIRERQTRSGWSEFELVGLDGSWDFRRVADWLRNDAGAWLLLRTEDALGDTRYWDFWLGGICGGRVVLHFETFAGVCLYATGRRSADALKALRPKLEQLQFPPASQDQHD